MTRDVVSFTVVGPDGIELNVDPGDWVVLSDISVSVWPSDLFVYRFAPSSSSGDDVGVDGDLTQWAEVSDPDRLFAAQENGASIEIYLSTGWAPVEGRRTRQEFDLAIRRIGWRFRVLLTNKPGLVPPSSGALSEGDGIRILLVVGE